ncbi:hypothetical protein PPGU19_039070 [Paraburkholderia sp. PGU19]|uniref:DUF2778 domain-containing protein n=1 Tax=Paraburkholderia sp. PGU19 TaxID=2735434 RepID=UPI0015DBC5F9|nr:DUF2778 domain-containing protein [Paraburkholderia sp. PGU19]BCF99338.1 hypothetical protein PPGU19_039070 [Paraburkholderia sp. PGU19]
MPVHCTFSLNNQDTSDLYRSGYGTVKAFSGAGRGRDNADATAMPDVGPLPRGTYYIVDRQSGGMMGWLYDWAGEHGIGTTDRSKWFMLWNPSGGDTTNINGIKRGSFRLHPRGPLGLSHGCVTVLYPADFESLARYIRARPPELPVPGAAFRAYGTLEVW